MSNSRISIMTPADARCLYKFFGGIDQAISERMPLSFPDEEHLTSLLCELLDDRAAKLHNLPYAKAQLNDDLKNAGSLLRASEITVNAKRYNKHQESRYTKSDLGIIIEYQDFVDGNLSFRKGVLLQAKKLFAVNGDEYSLSSRYESFDGEQHADLAKLEESYSKQPDGQRVHCDSVRYLLYNPPFGALPARDLEKVRHTQASRENDYAWRYSWRWYEYGAHVAPWLDHEEAARSLLAMGCLLSTVSLTHKLAGQAGNRSSRARKSGLVAFTLADVIEAVDVHRCSLPWFIVFDLLCGSAGCTRADFLDFISDPNASPRQEVGVIPPRYVIRIRLAAGTVRG